MCVEDETIAGIDSTLDALVNGSRSGLPCQAAPVAVQLESVDEVISLLVRTNQLNHREELLVTRELLLLFQHEHEVMVVARLDHHPIDRSAQVYVGRQKDYVLAL